MQPLTAESPGTGMCNPEGENGNGTVFLFQGTVRQGRFSILHKAASHT